MKKLLLAALVAGVAFIAFRAFRGASGPYGAYVTFATHVAKTEFAEAAALAGNDEVRAQVGGLGSAAGPVPMDAFRGVRFTKLSETRLPSGEVELGVEELLGFDPPGATTALGGAMYARFEHTARLQKGPGGWRVTSFERAFRKVVEAREAREGR